MGGEPLFALPPRVLVAGRLQCGAARAGVRRGRGECAELAHLAPRLHDWFYARHAEKRTFSEEVGRNTILAMWWVCMRADPDGKLGDFTQLPAKVGRDFSLVQS